MVHIYKRHFDWLFLVAPIWLVWHAYISHSLIHWPAHNIAQTRFLFSFKWGLCLVDFDRIRVFLFLLFVEYHHKWWTAAKNAIVSYVLYFWAGESRTVKRKRPKIVTELKFVVIRALNDRALIVNSCLVECKRHYFNDRYNVTLAMK